MIPRRFFWIFDLAAFWVAFDLAHTLLPLTQSVVAGAMRIGTLSDVVAIPPWLGTVPSIGELTWILLIVAVVGVVTLAAVGGHRSLLEQSRTRIVLSSLLAPGAGLSLITQILFALKNPDWSRLFIFSFAAWSALCLLAYRLALRAYFLERRRAGVYARNLLLIGQRAALISFGRNTSGLVAGGFYRLLGYLHFEAAEAETPLIGIPPLGRVAELRSILIHRPIHEVVLLQPATGGHWLRQVMADCDGLGVPLRVVPEELLDFEPRALRILHPPTPLAIPGIVLTTRHWDSNALYLKRLVDVVASAAMLILFSPIMILTAVAIRLSSAGPILYTWRVVGEQGLEFTGYKFRTMVKDADERKAELTRQNEMLGPVFKMTHDPRTTRVGRILRKYSVDELPQLYSVLKGDMSLVGPRPAFKKELERYEFWHKRKLSIRPGITCLWQVNGRNNIADFDEWVKMDLQYIDNWSLWLDFKILIRTAWVVVAGTGK